MPPPSPRFGSPAQEILKYLGLLLDPGTLHRPWWIQENNPPAVLGNPLPQRPTGTIVLLSHDNPRGKLGVIKRAAMIKVIEGYELKEGADIQPLFLKLRSYAMTFPGFISAEHIKSVKGRPISALLYDWENLENWAMWESSRLRQQILKEAEELIVSRPRITIYEVIPTSGWTYARFKP